MLVAVQSIETGAGVAGRWPLRLQSAGVGWVEVWDTVPVAVAFEVDSLKRWEIDLVSMVIAALS